MKGAVGMDCYKFKKEYAAAMNAVFGNDEPCLFAEFDLSPGGKYINGVAAAGKETVAFFVDGEVSCVIPIKQIKKAVCSIYKGCGVLEFKTDETDFCVARFSLLYNENCSVFAETVNDIIEGLNQ